MDLQAIVQDIFGEHGRMLGTAAAVLAGMVFAGAVLRWMTAAGKYPYKKLEHLFTPAERAFLSALQSAIGEHYWIAGKVRVADVLKVDGVWSEKARWRAFTKISSKHVDYVICEPGSYQIVAAIELDDRSHQRKARVKRDQFLDKAFENAGLPLIRFRTRRSYSPADIQKAIETATGHPTREAA